MISEALRRNRANGYDIGFFHSAQIIPTPFLTTRSANRLINTNKLIDVRYASLPRGMTRKDFAKKYELPKKDRFEIKGHIRRMEEKDIKEVLRLYKIQCEKHVVHLMFTEDHVRHLMMPREDIVMTYVVEDVESKGKLTDFMSLTYFHQQPLTQAELNHGYDMQTDATMYYYSFTNNKYIDMIKQALWLAKDDMKVDAMCCYEIMDHDTEMLTNELKFMPDSTPFFWYMLNYSFGEKEVKPSDMGAIFPWG